MATEQVRLAFGAWIEELLEHIFVGKRLGYKYSLMASLDFVSLNTSVQDMIHMIVCSLHLNNLYGYIMIFDLNFQHDFNFNSSVSCHH